MARAPDALQWRSLSLSGGRSQRRAATAAGAWAPCVMPCHESGAGAGAGRAPPL